MDNRNRLRNRKFIRPADSSKFEQNTQEEYAISEETNNPVAEALTTVEAIPDMDATLDTEVKETTPGTEALTQSRSLDDISEEFRFHYQRGSESAYRLGKLLIEAKAQLTEHGEWLGWLRDVNFPERQAQRLMRLAEGYPNPTPLSDLGLSKALLLLNVKEDERDEFINKPHMVHVRGGALMPIYVRDMSVRQLEYAIRAHNRTSEKNAPPKPTSQEPPLMSHSDALEASKPVSDVDSQFQFCESFINSLSDYMDNLGDGSDERDELTDKLRCLRELIDDTLERNYD